MLVDLAAYTLASVAAAVVAFAIVIVTNTWTIRNPDLVWLLNSLGTVIVGIFLYALPVSAIIIGWGEARRATDRFFVVAGGISAVTSFAILAAMAGGPASASLFAAVAIAGFAGGWVFARCRCRLNALRSRQGASA